MRKFLTSGSRRYALALVIVGACLAVMGASCAPTKPPPPPPAPHDEWYLTEVQVQPASPSGTYTVNTVCTLEDGTTFTHPATITHVAGQLDVQNFNWSVPGNGLGTISGGANAPAPASDPHICFAQEASGPGGTPSYWLTQALPAPFGTPPTYEAITAPTSTPQSCTLTFEATYSGNPPIDVWGNCFFAVSNA
jgi:hypothetical protein